MSPVAVPAEIHTRGPVHHAPPHDRGDLLYVIVDIGIAAGGPGKAVVEIVQVGDDDPSLSPQHQRQQQHAVASGACSVGEYQRRRIAWMRPRIEKMAGPTLGSDPDTSKAQSLDPIRARVRVRVRRGFEFRLVLGLESLHREPRREHRQSLRRAHIERDDRMQPVERLADQLLAGVGLGFDPVLTA